jgi:Protein of unknown function
MESENDYDPPMTESELKIVALLTPSDFEKIDKQILANIVVNWRKLARVVAQTMGDLEREFPLVPDLFYAHRVMVLTDNGLIEAQGNLKRLRYSEVRLPRISEAV